MADGYTARGVVTPEYWINEVARGKAFRRRYAREDSWMQWRRWYRGEFDERILPANVYFKFIRTLIPRIYYRNPSVSITPSKPGIENMLLCKLIERADNKLIDVLGVKGQMKRAVQHAVMFGTGGMRLGYGAQFTPTPEDLSTADPDVGGRSIQRRVEYNDLVHPNMPWLLAAHPGNVILPAGCSDIHSARWVCFETVRDYDDVKADPRLKNTADIMPGVQERGGLLSGADAAKPRGGVTLWEIRDKKTQEVFVLAPFSLNTQPGGKSLYQEHDDLQINGGVPFYPLIFNNDDEVFWGIPDSQILAPQQVEKNELRTQIRLHRRASVVKWLIEKGNMSPDAQSKLVDGNALSTAEVNNINGLKEVVTAQIPPGLVQSDALIDREIQELLGLGVNQFGEYAPGSADRSATESMIVNQATQIRVDERRDMCADMLVDMISDMNHVIIERWDSEMVMDVVGPAGVPIWIKFSPGELRTALYNMKVDPDTSIPMTKALREQKAVQTYGILKSNPLINPMELTRFLLTEMYGVDQDALMMNPAMQTSPDNPMSVGQAAQDIRRLPAPAIEDLRARLAAPAQVIPPTNIA